MHIFQLRDHIIRPATQAVDLWSPASDVLLLGTCGIETKYGAYVRQINGPALGVFQMEPATHYDLWMRYLNSKNMANRILDVCGDIAAPNGIPDENILTYNLYYATLMSRVFYLRIPERLPAENDALGMATYYKKYYNTSKGKTDLKKAVSVFKDLMTKLGGFNYGI